MPQGAENQERLPVEKPVESNNTATQVAALSFTDVRQDFNKFLDDLNRSNKNSSLDLLDRGLLPGFKLGKNSDNPVQSRDKEGRPSTIDLNGTALKVEYDKEGNVSKIVNADNSSKTFLDAQGVKDGKINVDKATGNISFKSPTGGDIEYNLKEGTKTQTSADKKERTITDANSNKTTQEGDGKGNYTTTGFTSKDGTEYKVETDQFNSKEIKSVSKVGEGGKAEKTVDGGKLSFDKQGRLTQQIGDRTNIYDKDLNLSQAKGKDGKTIEKVGENGVKALKLEKDGTLVADLGNNTFRATNADGSKVQYTQTAEGKDNFKRELQKLDATGAKTGPKYEMTVDKDGKIQGKEVTRHNEGGGTTKVPVEDGKLVEQQGDRKVTRDANLNATEITGKGGEKVAKVGERGVKSLTVDEKGNVTAGLGDNKFRAIDTEGKKTEYNEKPVAGKPNQVERTYTSPPGLSTTVEKGPGGKEEIIEAKRNGVTAAKVGDNGVKSIKLDDKNNVVADLGDNKTRLTTADGKNIEYQDKAVEGKPGQFERTFSNPPGYSMAVEKDKNGKEKILEVRKQDASGDNVTLAKVGDKKVQSIQGIDSEGKITSKLDDGKTFRVQGKDGKEVSKFTEKTEGDKTIRSFNPPAGVEVTMVNGQATEVKYDTKDRKETWKVGQDGTAVNQGGSGEPSKLEKAHVDPATGAIKGEAQLRDKQGQPEKVQVAVNPDGTRTETRIAKDKAGTNYEYKTTKDKDGHPTEVQHPILKDGKVVEGTTQTTKFDYERKDGQVVMKDGKPELKRIEFQTQTADGNEKSLALTKQSDGKWGLSESVYNHQTRKMEDRPMIGKDGKQVTWGANPQVENDGTLKLREADRSLSKFAPTGEIERKPAEDFSKGPESDAEKAAAKKRTEIVQVGTQSDGKKTWGQGVPSVMSQWGFDGYGADKGNLTETHMGDQGYTYTISQQVKDGQIERRETKFNTEKGVSIYYRDSDGSMKTIKGVTSMVSERQQDGSYKITYNVKGQNSGDANAPKPVSVNTTADGRYVDQDGMAVGGKLDAPAQPKVVAHTKAGNDGKPDNPQGNVRGLEHLIRNTDTSTEAGKKKADDLAQQLIAEQMRVEDQTIGKAIQDNNRPAQLEAERRKADLEYQMQSERERQKLIERVKKGESAAEKPVEQPKKPVAPVKPTPQVRPALPVIPFDPGYCPGGG